MSAEKINFLKQELAPLFLCLQPGAKGAWGVMNAQQMVEHLSDYVRIASGRDLHTTVFTPEQMQKAYSFMMTEKPFRENTPNQLMPAVPPPWRNADMKSAVAELQQEVDYFFEVYSQNQDLKITNPFFGDLAFKEQVHLLHKHATHHARQFGLL